MSLRELPRYPNQAFPICMSPIIHLAFPPQNQVVLWEMCKWRTQCRSAGVGGSISNAWRERYRNPLCIRDTPPSRKMWDIKPFYKAPSPATGAKKPHKDSPERGKSGNLIGIVQKEAAKQKIHNNNKTGFCLRKSKITRIWCSFFVDPRFFSGQKMFEPSVLLSVVSASPPRSRFH